MGPIKSTGKATLYIQLLNAATFGVVFFTVIYSLFYLNGLPEQLRIPGMAGGEIVNKSIFLDDLYLMVVSYLFVLLISVYVRVIPFRKNKGQAMVITVSLANLCICLIFARVIVGTLSQVI